MKQLTKSEKGSVLVITAFSLLVFIGLLGIIVDGGNLYVQRVDLQNTADASVLAGVQQLPDLPNKAQEAAMYTANQNNVPSTNVQINLSNNNTIITVSATRTVPLFFAAIVGIQNKTVRATAEAQIGSLAAAKGAIPLGVADTVNLSYGTQVKLKVGPADTSGNFGALVLSGTGASSYEQDLANGYPERLGVGQDLAIQTGNISGPTQKAVQYRLGNCPYHVQPTYYDYPANCARVVLVPVYSAIPGDTSRVRITNFAVFFLESVGPINEGSPITGRFIRSAFSGEFSTTIANKGAYAYKLTR